VIYGNHTAYTDGGTWYPEASNVIGLKYYLHSSFRKSLIERVNQYFKARKKDLMITIHVLEMNVNYFMYIIGYNFLFLCTIVSQR
jgi:hypothetical protein